MSFLSQLNTFRKSVRNVVTSKGIQASTESKLVKWCGVNGRDIYIWSDFVLKWSEVLYVEVIWDLVTCTLGWPYTEVICVLWLFYLVYILNCGCFNLFCKVWVCVCVGFVMCGCVYMWVCVCMGFLMCGCVCMYWFCNV